MSHRGRHAAELDRPGQLRPLQPGAVDVVLHERLDVLAQPGRPDPVEHLGRTV